MRHTNLHTGVSPIPEPANVGGYLPIAEHGLIGDLHTVALVGTEGTIDWYCCPRLEPPRRGRGSGFHAGRFFRPPAPPSDTTPVVRAWPGDLPRRGRAALRLRSAGAPHTPARTRCGLRVTNIGGC